MPKQSANLYKAFMQLQNETAVKNFLLDLLTPAEINEFTTRFKIAKLLWTTKISYAQIAAKLNTSTTTVTRVARFLYKEPYQGYHHVLQKLFPKQ